MDPSTSVQMCGLEEPEIIAVKVTQRKAVLGCGTLIEIKGLEFGDFVHTLGRRGTHGILKALVIK